MTLRMSQVARSYVAEARMAGMRLSVLSDSLGVGILTC